MFSTLIGHNFLKERFSALLASNAFPQVALFQGPSGVGKTLFATEVARSLTQCNKREAVDIMHLKAEGASSLHTVESVRALIKEANYPPLEAPVRVFILEEAHRMLPAASNALLKTLEEPAATSYFILTSSEPTRLLPTLLSRMQRFSFFSLGDKELRQGLEAHGFPATEETIRLAEGSLGRALHFAKEGPPPALGSAEFWNALAEVVEDEEAKLAKADTFFGLYLSEVQKRDPLKMEEAITRVEEGRRAAQAHIKLKTVFERVIEGA